MSVRSAIDPANLHDEAFARDPFTGWEDVRNEAPLSHDTVDEMSRGYRVVLTKGGSR